MKKQMMQAELLNHQLEEIQKQLSELDDQHSEVISLKESLQEFETVKQGEELLVPFAPGIFTKSTAAADKRLFVNVGQGVVVPRDVEHVNGMLEEQLEKIEQYQNGLREQFDNMFEELKRLEKEMK